LNIVIRNEGGSLQLDEVWCCSLIELWRWPIEVIWTLLIVIIRVIGIVKLLVPSLYRTIDTILLWISGVNTLKVRRGIESVYIMEWFLVLCSWLELVTRLPYISSETHQVLWSYPWLRCCPLLLLLTLHKITNLINFDSRVSFVLSSLYMFLSSSELILRQVLASYCAKGVKLVVD
jgi:hypothetical protein